MKIPDVLKTGVKFRSSAGEYTVAEDDFIFGLFFLGMFGFCSYILFFRPDIHGEVNTLIRIFRVLFPAAFGFAGLWLLGSRRKTTFDLSRNTFRWREMVFFITAFREGGFADIKRVLLSAKQELYSAHGDSGIDRYRWLISISLDVGDKILTLAKWTGEIDGNRPQDEAVAEARARAAELAGFIGCPLIFPAEDAALK